jgi:predicted RNA binding protein YcfA (HicA-like mRNA interferase family)
VKVPRHISGKKLGKSLRKLGYIFVRQKGSHMRYATEQNGIHSVTIPDHDPMRIGTLHDILKDIATHHGMPLEQLLQYLEL